MISTIFESVVVVSLRAGCTIIHRIRTRSEQIKGQPKKATIDSEAHTLTLIPNPKDFISTPSANRRKQHAPRDSVESWKLSYVLTLKKVKPACGLDRKYIQTPRPDSLVHPVLVYVCRFKSMASFHKSQFFIIQHGLCERH